MKLGHLYFLQVAPFGPVKIGWTSGCVTTRMRALQQASPYEIKWLGIAELPRSAEKDAHRVLSAYHLRGEWFHPTPGVMAFVERVSAAFDLQSYIEFYFRPSLQSRLRKLTNHRPEERDFICEAAKISSHDVFHWLNRTRLLPQEQLDALEEAAMAAERSRAH